MKIKDLLHLLGSTATNELLLDLFKQLKMLPRYYFNKAITDLEQQYYLGQEHGLTCLTLCTKVIEICQIQEQAQQWDAAAPDDLNLQALCSMLVAHQDVIEALVAKPKFHQQHKHRHEPHPDGNNLHHFCKTPSWINEPPDIPTTTRQYNNKTWFFCNQCRGGTWNTMHDTANHVPNFQNLHSPSNHQND